MEPYSATMFLPHRADRQTGEFRTLTDAVGMSRYYAAVSRYLNEEDQNLDSWSGIFRNVPESAARWIIRRPTGGSAA